MRSSVGAWKTCPHKTVLVRYSGAALLRGNSIVAARCRYDNECLSDFLPVVRSASAVQPSVVELLIHAARDHCRQSRCYMNASTLVSFAKLGWVS